MAVKIRRADMRSRFPNLSGVDSCRSSHAVNFAVLSSPLNDSNPARHC
jgi:hypothetical protein